VKAARPAAAAAVGGAQQVHARSFAAISATAFHVASGELSSATST
jgi:hypothetical protein